MMDISQYRLRYSQSGGAWQEMALELGQYTIGRSPDCDLVLPVAAVSRHHARLEIDHEGIFIIDLGSSNGTILEGKPLPPNHRKPISSGQVIKIADFEIVIEAIRVGGAPLPEPTTESSEQGATRLDRNVEAMGNLPTRVGDGDLIPPAPEQPRPAVPEKPLPQAAAIHPPALEEEQATRLDKTKSEVAPVPTPTGDLAAHIVLRFRKGEEPWQERLISPGEYIFGRVSDCDFILPETDVSRRHTRLEVTREGVFIWDLGSANGTQLNGEPLPPRQRRPITNGQNFTICDYIFELVVPTQQEIEDLETHLMNTGAIGGGTATQVDEGLYEAELATQLEEAVPPQATLRYRKGEENWQEKTLQAGTFIIGRTAECEISLQDPQLSRRHAQIEVDKDGCYISDLGSANGTFLDGVKLEPNQRIALKVGQQISLGSCMMRIEAIPSPAGAAAARTRVGVHAAPTRIGERGPVTRVSAPAAMLLRYRRADGPWQNYTLRDGEQIIGRGTDAQIQLDSQIVSRHHARVRVKGDQIWVADLGSKNGVQYKGSNLIPQQDYPLSTGDIFQVDEFTFEYIGKEGFAAAGAATAVVSGLAAIPMVTPTDGATIIGADLGLGMDVGIPTLAKTPFNLMGQERVTIGREPDNHIVLNHPMVSRYHAVIERMGKRTRIIDMHSANGVYVNGVPVDGQAWLQQGDYIKVGPYQIQFTGNELRPSTVESYTIDAIGIQKWVSKTLNLLKDISLSVGQNEFVALVGMSGAGKSTLMDAINGFRPGTHGQVMINGVDLYRNYGMFRDEIGNVPQKDIVHTELTPEQALDYAAQLRMPADTSRAERKASVDETLKDLGLDGKRNVPISRLSGGQLKRVSIGVELLTKPRLFFLDEPTSGLDPGTEYEMMKLLRRLADQGRTIMIITHATKNVMFCDKAIILAKGGNLAFYGPPENALQYFDKYRTKREQLEKDMEFDDIYRILEDPARGKPEEWRERYLKSEYARYVKPQYKGISPTQAYAGAGRQQRGKRISALRQFIILSSRNLRCLLQDKASLGLTLALAPVLGLLNFIWKRNLFDPVLGDSAKVMSMWFITAVIALLVGSMGSVREIVKENDIYKRERAVGLKIAPYVLSKIWLGIALAIYQGVVILIALLILVNPHLTSILGYLALLVTLILSIICGYLLGLLVSALSPNQNSAQIILIAFLVPQMLLAGMLQPLDQIPLGKVLSPFIATRWTYEAFAKSTGMGDVLNNDPCWDLPADQRAMMNEDFKIENCTCMGPQLFENCGEMPGILSADFYDEDSQQALAQAEPVEPEEPTRIPSPTRRVTPTLLATPTYLPTPTYYPTPTYLPTPTPYDTPTAVPFSLHYNEDVCGTPSGAYSVDQENCYRGYVSARINNYQSTREAQFQEYSETREAQFMEYRDDTVNQVDEYKVDMESQVDEYRDNLEDSAEGYKEDVEQQANDFIELEKGSYEAYGEQAFQQFEDYADEMADYGDVRANWERKRQEAIGAAEAILGMIKDNYGKAFEGSVSVRWLYIALITFAEFFLILIMQKRKDKIR